MPASLARIVLVCLAWLMLSSFRLHTAESGADPLLYDVRGAFVTGSPAISRLLVDETDRLVDQSIRATFRKTAVPRAVLTIRIVETGHLPLVVGARVRAKVTVEATAVGNGEKIAAGGFTISTFALDGRHAQARLAARIAQRVAEEFRLRDAGRSTLATALFP
jgi:hypothetical protein